MVPITGERMVPLTDEDVAAFAESRLRQAEKCCLCERCGASVPRGSEKDWRHRRTCEGCLPAVLAEQAERERQWAEDEEKRGRAYEAAIAKAKSQPAAERLVAEMRLISELHYMAGWDSLLEWHLWDMVQGGSRNALVGEVDQESVELLRTLSEEAGGWWRYSLDDLDEPSGERFVPLAEWLSLYEAHVAEVKARAEARKERGDG
jgi:hypothetical protein